MIPRLFTADLEPVGVAATSSTYTQEGPRPGQAIADDGLNIGRLSVSAAQGVDFEVIATAAGNPGTGAAFAVRQAGEPDTSWRGWDGPQLLSGWFPVDYAAGTVTARSYDMATIPSNQVTVIADYDNHTTNLKTYIVPASVGITQQNLVAKTAATTWNDPAIVVLDESERVLIFFGNSAYYTDDFGVTLSDWSEAIVAESTTNFGRTRAAVYRGSIVLLISDTATAGTVHHYASADLGASFQLISTYTGLGLDVDVSATQYGLVVTYLAGVTRPGAPQCRILQSAWEEIDLQDSVEISATTRNYATSSVDAGGKIYLFARTNHSTVLYSSVDLGFTWQLWDQGPTRQGDTTDRLDQFASTWAMGRLLVLHMSSATSAGVNWMLGLLALGGHSSVTMGIISTGTTAAAPENRWGWSGQIAAGRAGATWIPIELPSNSGWANTGTAPTLATPGELVVSTSTATSFSSLIPAAGTDQLCFEAQMRLASGGSEVSRECAIVLRLADGVFDYEIEILIYATGYEVNDMHSATTASVIRDTTAQQWQIRLYMVAGNIQVWDRDTGSSVWNVGADLAITNDSGSPAASGIFAFGTLASSTTDSRWGMVNWVASNSATSAPQLVTGTDVLSKPWTANPEPIPEMGSPVVSSNFPAVAWLALSAGPARKSDTWTVAAKYDHGIQNIDPVKSPSPAQTWRSSNKLAEQLIVWDMGADSWLGDSVALYIGNANFRTAYLEKWTGAAWVIAATLDLADGFTALEHSLDGYTVVPNTAAAPTPDRFLWDSELVGAWVMLDPTATVSESHRISIQTAGSWTNETTVHPTLVLDTLPGLVQGVLDIDGATRGCNLVHGSGFVIVHPTTQQIARYYRVRIPAGLGGVDSPSADSYYEAGTIAVCRVLPFGVQPGWGYSDELTPNIDVTTDAAGTRHAQQRAAPSRAITVSLTDLAGLVEIRAGTDVNFVAGTGGVPLAAHNDVGQLVQGMFRQTEGGAIPVVFVEHFPETTGAIVTDPSLFLYSHMTGSARINNVSGDLGIDEVNRVESIVFMELV